MGSISPILCHFQVNNTDVSYLSSTIRAGMGEIQHFVRSFKAALKSVEGDKLSLLSENSFSLLEQPQLHKGCSCPKASQGETLPQERWEKPGGFWGPSAFQGGEVPGSEKTSGEGQLWILMSHVHPTPR